VSCIITMTVIHDIVIVSYVEALLNVTHYFKLRETVSSSLSRRPAMFTHDTCRGLQNLPCFSSLPVLAPSERLHGGVSAGGAGDRAARGSDNTRSGQYGLRSVRGQVIVSSVSGNNSVGSVRFRSARRQVCTCGVEGQVSTGSGPGAG
jgi:hypothetical protein